MLLQAAHQGIARQLHHEVVGNHEIMVSKVFGVFAHGGQCVGALNVLAWRLDDSQHNRILVGKLAMVTFRYQVMLRRSCAAALLWTDYRACRSLCDLGIFRFIMEHYFPLHVP
ncbi:hypothetical protein D3C71_1563490 [compost metagenome]